MLVERTNICLNCQSNTSVNPLSLLDSPLPALSSKIVSVGILVMSPSVLYSNSYLFCLSPANVVPPDFHIAYNFFTTASLLFPKDLVHNTLCITFFNSPNIFSTTICTLAILSSVASNCLYIFYLLSFLSAELLWYQNVAFTFIYSQERIQLYITREDEFSALVASICPLIKAYPNPRIWYIYFDHDFSTTIQSHRLARYPAPS